MLDFNSWTKTACIHGNRDQATVQLWYRATVASNRWMHLNWWGLLASNGWMQLWHGTTVAPQVFSRNRNVFLF